MSVIQTDTKFSTVLKETGWMVADAVLGEAFIGRLNDDLEIAYRTCRDIQQRNGVDVNTDGTVHHVVASGGSFLELLERNVLGEMVDEYFGSKWILNSFGGVINQPSRPSYVCNVHRDVRFFTGSLPVMLNMLIMLDDFTLSNGATYLLSGSHRRAEKPTDELFFEQADRAVGSRGSILLFDASVWHAAGLNRTERVRRALTLTFTKSCFKQQLDYCRLIGYDQIAASSPHLKQVLGFNARVPANLDEWYQKPENRFYQPGQD